MEIRALSLLQPWASAVALGLKQFETRSWKTPYRGRVAIHASKGWTVECSGVFYYNDIVNHEFEVYGIDDHKDFPRGRIVAIAKLVDIYRAEDVVNRLSDKEFAFGNFGPGRYAWEFADVRPWIGPEVKGKLGLWTLDPEYHEEAQDVLETVTPNYLGPFSLEKQNRERPESPF